VRSHPVPVALVGECSIPVVVERRPPAAVVVLRQLQVEALAVHAHGDVPDPRPRIEPGSEGVERAIVRAHRAPGKAERRHEEPAALVEHAVTLRGRRRHVNGLMKSAGAHGASTGTSGFTPASRRPLALGVIGRCWRFAELVRRAAEPDPHFSICSI